MLTKIEDVVAFITGGASGIGKCIAEMITSKGGKVVIADMNEAGQKVADGFGDKAVFVRTDVTSEVDVTFALNLTKQTFGKLNLIVNCAGIIGGEPIYDFVARKPHSADEWNKYFRVNVFGTFNVIRLAVPIMTDNVPDEDNQRGLIVNLGSAAGYGVTDDFLAYGASKAAVMSMTEPLARFLAEYGIRVVALAPGVTDTPLIANGVPDDMRDNIVGEQMNPLRMGKPEEIMHLVKCLIENHYINAEVIRIDGGLRACNKKCVRKY